VTTVNSTALLVEWNVPLTVRGVRSEYRITYNLSTEDSFLNTNYDPITVDVNVFSQILTGLHEFAAYDVIVQARNDKGFGDIAMETGMTNQSGRFIFVSRALCFSLSRSIIICFFDHYICLH